MYYYIYTECVPLFIITYLFAVVAIFIMVFFLASLCNLDIFVCFSKEALPLFNELVSISVHIIFKDVFIVRCRFVKHLLFNRENGFSTNVRKENTLPLHNLISYIYTNTYLQYISSKGDILVDI